jgi:hypothetical protein
MGYSNLNESSGTGSGERGPRGPQGINGVGISSITTVDNNDGSLSLTVNLTDGTTQGPFTNTLVSDTLINLNKLSLEGTDDVNKLLVKQANETLVMNANSVNGVVEIPNLKSDKLIVGNTLYNLPATNLENGILKSTLVGPDINIEWTQAPPNEQFGTGLRMGGVISVNGTDPTKFDLGAGEGVITTTELTYFSWNTFTGVSIPDPIPLQPNTTPISLITSRILTYISIDSSGTILFSSELPNPVSQRSFVYIGVLVHTQTTNPIPNYTINTVNHQQVCIENGVNQLHDLCSVIGFINVSGNSLFLGTGGGNKIAKESGKIFAVNANSRFSKDNPHIVTLPTVNTGVGGTFQYRNLNGTSSALTLTDFNPNLYDDGEDYNGLTPTLPQNKWGISYVFTFTSGALKVQPPQYSYSSSTEALLNLDSENFIIEPSIAANGLLIGYIVAKQGQTLQSAPALFVKAKKFGSSGGGSSGTGIDLSGRLAVDGSNAMTASLLSNTDNLYSLGSELARWKFGHIVKVISDIVDTTNIISERLYVVCDQENISLTSTVGSIIQTADVTIDLTAPTINLNSDVTIEPHQVNIIGAVNVKQELSTDTFQIVGDINQPLFTVDGPQGLTSINDMDFSVGTVLNVEVSPDRKFTIDNAGVKIKQISLDSKFEIVGDVAELPLLKIDGPLGDARVSNMQFTVNDKFVVSTTGDTSVKTNSNDAFGVKTSANSSIFKVNTATPDVTINGKLNGSVEGDIFYASAGGLLTKLSKPATNDCYKLVFEGGSLQWEPQIFSRLAWALAQNNGSVIVFRYPLGTPIYYPLPYNNNGTGIIISQPANYFTFGSFIGAGGAGIDHLGFFYNNGPPCTIMIMISLQIYLKTDQPVFCAIFKDNVEVISTIVIGKSANDDHFPFNLSTIADVVSGSKFEVKSKCNTADNVNDNWLGGFHITVHRIC